MKNREVGTKVVGNKFHATTKDAKSGRVFHESFSLGDFEVFCFDEKQIKNIKKANK